MSKKKIDKRKLFTKILAATLAGMTVLGVAITLIFQFI